MQVPLLKHSTPSAFTRKLLLSKPPHARKGRGLRGRGRDGLRRRRLLSNAEISTAPRILPACRRTGEETVASAQHHGAEPLPDDIARLIPKFTLSQMRRQDPSYHFGAEYATLIEQMELLKEIARCRTALKTASTVLRIAHLVRSLQVPVQRIKRIKALELRAKIVTAVERAKAVLPLAHILKFFGLTHSRIRVWSRNTFACIGSPRALCRTVYPNQLTRSEVNTIREAFTAQMPKAREYLKLPAERGLAS